MKRILVLLLIPATVWAINFGDVPPTTVEPSSIWEAALGNPAANGYVLSSTTLGIRSWIPAGGSGTVTSVALAMPNGGYTITGSPVTTSGTLTATQHVADSTHDGYLSLTDWNTFNGKSTVTPAALTKTDDTNVTLTLGGTPTTALLQATSITAGWSGTLAVSRGGTGAATFPAHSYLGNNTGSTAAPAPHVIDYSELTNTPTPAPTAPQDFGIVAVSGQSNVVADQVNDTLTLVAGTNITLTTNASTDTVTITAAGGGGGTPGGSNTQYQYNNSSAFGGVPSMTYDGTIPGTVTLTPAANTYATGILFTDTTAAASGGQQYSPSLVFHGSGWKTASTAASQVVDWRLTSVPVQATSNPSGSFVFDASINHASPSYAPAFKIMYEGDSVGGQVLAMDGYSASLSGHPAYSFINDATMGMYRGGSSNISLALAGNQELEFTTSHSWIKSGFVDLGGTNTNPASRIKDDSSNGIAVLESNSATNAWGSVKAGAYNASSNTVSDGLVLGHINNGGAGAASMGSGISFTIEDSTTDDVSAGEVAVLWTTATHNSNVSDFVVKLDNGSATPAEAFRVTGAGVASAGGVTIPTISSTNTLTNKRITKRVETPTAAGGATYTVNTDNYDGSGIVTSGTGTITIDVSGTPTNMQPLMIRIDEGGTAHALTWTSGAGKFRTVAVTLPSTTVANKTTYALCSWNPTGSTSWDSLATGTQP